MAKLDKFPCVALLSRKLMKREPQLLFERCLSEKVNSLGENLLEITFMVPLRRLTGANPGYGREGYNTVYGPVKGEARSVFEEEQWRTIPDYGPL